MDSLDYYSKNASEYYENTVELNMEETLEDFIQLIPEGSSVLDLGCGSGRDSFYLIEKGFDVTALEGSEQLCELAQIHIGQDVLNIKYEDMSFHDVFDGIWACASLVHIQPEEIDHILDKVIRSLKTNGVLYMSFKYGDFSGIRNNRYFNDYKTRSLKELIARHKELEIIEMWKSDDIRSDRENQEWINVFVKKRVAED